MEERCGAADKALKINLDGVRYGTFAEIGAGQEVARWFFHVGKASSTVACSISAYDMAISTNMYGPAPHFVSRARLEAMLDREFGRLVEQLDATRGGRNAFFALADTAATSGSRRSSGGHGWMGIRFQDRPRAKPSEVIVHIEMLDAFASRQQEAVGLVGVNLAYGAFYQSGDPLALIRSLMDGLDRRRIQIDMIKFSGPAFEGVDQRLISLQLVEMGFTDAAMFTAKGEVVQPSEVLYGKPVLIGRGSFRPVTKVTMTMLQAGLQQLREQSEADAGELVAVLEMTLKNLMSGEAIDRQDFLARADILGALGKTVMISSYTRFDDVITNLRQYTKARIAMAVGLPTLRAIFDPQYYGDLSGGILEGLGRLFSGRVELLAYPTVGESGELETADHLEVSPNLKHLYAHLLENGFIQPVQHVSKEQLDVSPADVLEKIRSGDASWVDFVPPEAAEVIKREGLFGYRA